MSFHDDDDEDEEYEYYEEEDVDPDSVGIPLSEVDWDAAWLHFKSMRPTHQPARAFENLVGCAMAACFFAFILHTCMLPTSPSLPPCLHRSPRRSSPSSFSIVRPHHLADIARTGGLVVVPDEGVLQIYNFAELSKMEPSHLHRLGLPAPALPASAPLSAFQRAMLFTHTR